MIFRINDKFTVKCETKKTRNGFKHTATLWCNDRELETVKMCYLNRTWERYTYESVLSKLLDKVKGWLEPKQVEQFKSMIANGGKAEMDAMGAIGIIARMGEVFATTKTEANDWKARMLNAGLGGAGLIMPDDWDTLDEDTKEKRLNGVIKILQENNNPLGDKHSLICTHKGCTELQGGDDEFCAKHTN